MQRRTKNTSKKKNIYIYIYIYQNPQTQKSHLHQLWRRIAVRLDQAQIIEERGHLNRSAEATDLCPLRQ